MLSRRFAASLTSRNDVDEQLTSNDMIIDAAVMMSVPIGFIVGKQSDMFHGHHHNPSGTEWRRYYGFPKPPTNDSFGGSASITTAPVAGNVTVPI